MSRYRIQRSRQVRGDNRGADMVAIVGRKKKGNRGCSVGLGMAAVMDCRVLVWSPVAFASKDMRLEGRKRQALCTVLPSR